MSNGNFKYSFPTSISFPPVPTPVDQRTPHGIHGMALTDEVSYYNGTGRTVYLIFRDGTMIELGPKLNPGFEPHFEIHKMIKYPNTVKFDIPTLLDDDNSYQVSLNRKRYAEQADFDAQHSDYIRNGSSRYLLHKIEQSVLVDQKSIYVPNLDIVISLEHPRSGISHPLNLQGDHFSLMSIQHQRFNTSMITSINLMLVDNDGVVGPKYLNVSGRIMRLRPIVDYTRPSGLHVFHTEDDILRPPETYPLDKVNESGFLLFNSHSEAVTGGDPKALFELDLASKKREHEILVLELKENLDRATAETKKAEAKLRQQELDSKAQLHVLEQENREFKRIQEKREARRKNLTEDIKWGVAIFAGIITSAAIIIKALKTE